jgi:creatinine amidohydrolase
MTGPLRGAFLEDLTWLEAKAWFDRDPVIVIGIGAIAKEHGHHLPLNTDFRIARALLEGVGRALPVLLAPILSVGYYPAFRHYPGSQHLEAETFIAVLRELLGGFIRQGARRLAIVNTGVSTEGPIRILVRDLLEARGIRVAVADIATLGRKADPHFQQKLGGHADEHETSLMLAIAPDSVRLGLARPNYGNALGSPKTVFYQPTIFSGEPTSGIDYSEQGARGDPTLATAEKGRQALDAMIEDLVSGLVALHPDLG